MNFYSNLSYYTFRLKILGNEKNFRKISNWLRAQSSTKCSLQKQKFGHGNKKLKKKTFDSMSYFTQLRRLISNIL